MKMYHEYNMHTSQQEEQMEKDINERAQTMRQAKDERVETDHGSALEGCRTDQLRSATQEMIDTHSRSVQK